MKQSILSNIKESIPGLIYAVAMTTLIFLCTPIVLGIAFGVWYVILYLFGVVQ